MSLLDVVWLELPHTPRPRYHDREVISTGYACQGMSTGALAVVLTVDSAMRFRQLASPRDEFAGLGHANCYHIIMLTPSRDCKEVRSAEAL